MDPGWLVYPGLLIWSVILLLPWRPWSTREVLDASPGPIKDLADITVLIPARNEAEYISDTLDGLVHQGENLRIILIDDQSSDDTRSIALGTGYKNLKIIDGEPLPTGWSGKLWALEQGRRSVDTPYILLLDADIYLQPGTIATLLDKLKQEGLHLVSLMAHLRMVSLWEKLLMPAFIYFFKLLYPFRISNSESSLVAAAAGGCILIDAKSLEEIGGFSSLSDELIDDCALARRIKNNNNRIWIGLTHSAISNRKYNDLKSVWKMVARTAYTQLHYSTYLLVLCTITLLAAFVFPFICLFSADPFLITASILTLILMVITYLPTLKFYGLQMYWALFLPFIGILYLLMTLDSAISHWRGSGTIWKERTYPS